MKTVIILLGLVALVASSVLPPKSQGPTTKDVSPEYVKVQKQILQLFEDIEQVDIEAEYYKIGNEYDIGANTDKYNNKEVVEKFLKMYKSGSFLPKYYEFSIFQEAMREQAIALFKLFYAAKDFETFYKTAAWARVNLNEGLFLYTYYIAILQRLDTHGYVLPPPYEVYPQLFSNLDVFTRIDHIKMQNGILNKDAAIQYGIVEEDKKFIIYGNDSSTFLANNKEQKLAYFTEDVGFNAYYYYFHSHLPFWWSSDKYKMLKEHRGEFYFYFYQQLLARYNLERITNQLGSIGEFSWYSPLETGFYPMMSTYYYPFSQRPEYYNMHMPENYEKIRFLDTYEKTFVQFLQQGYFTIFNETINFNDPKAINFVGNYWQDNADLYKEDVVKKYQRSYEIVARKVLGAAPKAVEKNTFMPSALDFYQTSLRDPVFYQLYSRIMDYIIEFKEYLKPYTSEELLYPGVEVTDVETTELTTYFEYYDFDASTGLFFTKKEMKSHPYKFVIRQPRLNHKPFDVNIDIKSEVASQAVIKIMLKPKYDEYGFVANLEKSWMKSYELDRFVVKLQPGQNKITRNSNDFVYFKEDSVSMSELLNLLGQGKVPKDMSERVYLMPDRLMLPKGTKGGAVFQLFAFVYPYEETQKDLGEFQGDLSLDKPFGYPLDRPVFDSNNFKVPNVYFKDVYIKHLGDPYPYTMNVPSHFSQANVVPKN